MVCRNFLYYMIFTFHFSLYSLHSSLFIFHYFCHPFGPVVQWIVCRFPEPKIQVRSLSGLQSLKEKGRLASSFFLLLAPGTKGVPMINDIPGNDFSRHAALLNVLSFHNILTLANLSA